MKIVDFFESQVKAEVEKMRPPEDIRPKLDIGYKYENKTFEIFEISPNWMKESESIETSVAKCRYIKSKQVWKIYWKRASGRW